MPIRTAPCLLLTDPPVKLLLFSRVQTLRESSPPSLLHLRKLIRGWFLLPQMTPTTHSCASWPGSDLFEMLIVSVELVPVEAMVHYRRRGRSGLECVR